MATRVELKKEISDLESEGAWHQDELIGGNRQL
jgi:hypothetical protein